MWSVTLTAFDSFGWNLSIKDMFYVPKKPMQYTSVQAQQDVLRFIKLADI